MITVVQGKLGSGKSYDCVRMIADHLKKGGCVRTNISLDYKIIGAIIGRRLSPYQIGSVSANDNPSDIPIGDKRGKGKRRTLVILDEALNWFASTTDKTDNRKSTWGEWLRQSDKLGQDVFFIAQNFERSAKWIRELAQVCRDVVSLKQFAVFGFVPLWYFFPPFRWMYLVRSFDVASKERISLELHIYESRIFRMYDTSETYGFQSAFSAYDSVSLFPRYNPPLAPLYLCLLLVLFHCAGVIFIFA